jgi:hypothetical protein
VSSSTFSGIFTGVSTFAIISLSECNSIITGVAIGLTMALIGAFMGVVLDKIKEVN